MKDSRDASPVEIEYYRLNIEEKERLLKSLVGRLENMEGVVFAYVYGSFIEMDAFRDVDVAVWIENPGDAFSYEVDLSARLEADLKKPIDIHVLNRSPLPFRQEIFTGGRLLFSKDEERRIRLIDETLRQYADVRMLNATASR